MAQYSRYLMEEHPISFHATLACAIGLNEAILLQKLNLWLNCKPHYPNGCDDRGWIYNSYKSWQEQLPFWSVDTVKRTLKSLENKKILLKHNFNKAKFDRTLWYSIDYDKLDEIVNEYKSNLSIGANCTNGYSQNAPTNTNEYTMNTNICSSDNFEQEKLEENNVQNDEQVDKKFIANKENFEIIWGKYPRKDGKSQAYKHYELWLTRGKKVLGKTIKLDNRIIFDAVENYCDYLKANKVDNKYIKMGSTFFNEGLLDFIGLEE